MRADAERLCCACASNCGAGGRRSREQAGARHDAELVRVEDAVVDALGEPEVVSVHDEMPQHGYRSATRNTCAARRSLSGFPAKAFRQHGAARIATRASVADGDRAATPAVHKAGERTELMESAGMMRSGRGKQCSRLVVWKSPMNSGSFSVC